jgi:hypothetical protein
VLALLLGLLVEEHAELRERLRRVVRADPNVLMGRRELTGDLLVQGVHETLRQHGSPSARRRGGRRSKRAGVERPDAGGPAARRSPPVIKGGGHLFLLVEPQSAVGRLLGFLDERM